MVHLPQQALVCAEGSGVTQLRPAGFVDVDPGLGRWLNSRHVGVTSPTLPAALGRWLDTLRGRVPGSGAVGCPCSRVTNHCLWGGSGTFTVSG
jgi:hypothetical protein